VAAGLRATAEGVTIVGQEGVDIACEERGVGTGLQEHQGTRAAERVRFKSVHCSPGVVIASGSVTMSRCIVTGRQIHVLLDAFLDMEYCNAYECVSCIGKMVATRCSIEGQTPWSDTADHGVWVCGHAKLSECAVHNDKACGVYANGGTVILSGGMISGNKWNGV